MTGFSAPSGLNLVKRAAEGRQWTAWERYRQGKLTGNGETTNGLLVLKLKAETLGVVAQGLNARDLEVNPLLAVEDLGAVLGVNRGVVTVVAPKTSTQTSSTNADVDGSQVRLLRRRAGGLRSGLGGGLSRVLAEALSGKREFLTEKNRTWKIADLLEGLRVAEGLTGEHCGNQ